MNDLYWERLLNDLNDPSACWERLLKEIRSRHLVIAEFPDYEADLYGLSNELLMREMRERLLEALETNWTDPHKYYAVIFGNKFIATMNEQQQRSFLRRIVALPVRRIVVGYTTNNGAQKPAITICTAALLDALANLSSFVFDFGLVNFALRNQSDVESLSNIILAKRETLRYIYLEDIECHIDYNKQDRDAQIGFLDPLLYASSRMEQLSSFGLSARTPPSHSSLVSTNAVRALFSQGRRMDALRLNGLGLKDSHCYAIAEELRTSGRTWLHLRCNPAISDEGYGALLGLLNFSICTFRVDDNHWKAKLNLVSEMNREHGRLEYMTDGSFSSEERGWQWLKKLVSLPNLRHRNEYLWEAKHMNFIWYELLEHPEFMQT